MRPLVLAVLCLLGASCAIVLAASTGTAAKVKGPSVDLTLQPGPDTLGRVVENVLDDRYVVGGDTADAVRANLNRQGPYSAAEGRIYDAATQWGLRWTFRYNEDTAHCWLQNATIEMVVVTTLPELSSASRLDANSMAAWQRYIDALEMHESGHLENVRQGARALQAAFDDVGAMSSCRELGAHLDALGRAYQEALRDSDLEYDAATGHGRNQGAVFP